MTNTRTPLDAFKAQRSAARQRGIAFHFTFEEWVTWWESNLGPDWLKLRGRITGKYVMARKGDVGDYEITNVLCVTVSQNYAMRVSQRKFPKHVPKVDANGKRIYAVLNKNKAKKIYEAVGSQNEIARTFGVSARLVRMIKAKQIWLSCHEC